MRLRNIAGVLFFLLVAGNALTPARASFSTNSSESLPILATKGDLDAISRLFSNQGVPAKTIDRVLNDQANKISREFHVPREIRSNVAFWLKIYTQYTSQQVVYFDGRHPEVIYEVMDFSELARTAKNPVVYEVTAKRRLKNTTEAYEKAFARLAKNSRPVNPTHAEVMILTAIKKSPHRHPFGEWKRDLRSQTGQRDFVLKGLVSAESYLPKMEAIFKQLEIPIELTRLSLVESSFNMAATSRVGASGVWQFMPESGKEYLLIDEDGLIDERLSPLKSTVAAGRLLKRNNSTLNNWALAVLAYNHGMRNLRSLASKKYRPFTALAPLFAPCTSKKDSKIGWASRNYYSEFLAMLHAEAYRDVFFGEIPSSELRRLEFLRVDRPQNALSFAMSKGVALQDFRLLNPDIRDLGTKLPRNFLVALPAVSDNLAGLTQRRSLR